MAKELPYFQFEPAEYLTKDVSFCSLEAQGLFINICCYYWQRECKLSKSQLLKRLNYPDILNELVSEGIIVFNGDDLIIKFLDNQYLKATKKSQVNSQNGAKGGRPKKQKETEIKPNENPIKSESKGIREDKRKEDNKREDNIGTKVPDWLDFFNYAEEKAVELNYYLDESKLKAKYLAWKEAGWQTGKNKKIKNWKSTLLNTLVYLRIDENQKTESFTDFGNKLLEKYKA